MNDEIENGKIENIVVGGKKKGRRIRTKVGERKVRSLRAICLL